MGIRSKTVETEEDINMTSLLDVLFLSLIHI